MITPDDGNRRCPKHVEFRDKIKFWILDAFCWLFVRMIRCLDVAIQYLKYEVKRAGTGSVSFVLLSEGVTDPVLNYFIY
jgi:hypothetical protein